MFVNRSEDRWRRTVYVSRGQDEQPRDRVKDGKPGFVRTSFVGGAHHSSTQKESDDDYATDWETINVSREIQFGIGNLLFRRLAFSICVVDLFDE